MLEGQLRGIRRRVTASWRACHCPEICCSLGVQRYDIYLDCAWILEEIICKASTKNQVYLFLLTSRSNFYTKERKYRRFLTDVRCWRYKRRLFNFFYNYLHICIFFHNLAVEIIPKTLIHMERIKKIVRFYINGFKNMTWGKELWILIIIKLVIMFGILRLFFFHPVAPSIAM